MIPENGVVERIAEWAASPDAVAADKTASALATIRKDVVRLLNIPHQVRFIHTATRLTSS